MAGISAINSGPSHYRDLQAQKKLDPKIEKTARDFEAVTLGEMLQPMFDTVDTSAGTFGGGSAEKQFRSLQVMELGKQIANNGGVGIAHQVYQKMVEMQKGGSRR